MAGRLRFRFQTAEGTERPLGRVLREQVRVQELLRVLQEQEPVQVQELPLWVQVLLRVLRKRLPLWLRYKHFRLL